MFLKATEKRGSIRKEDLGSPQGTLHSRIQLRGCYCFIIGVAKRLACLFRRLPSRACLPAGPSALLCCLCYSEYVALVPTCNLGQNTFYTLCDGQPIGCARNLLGGARRDVIGSNDFRDRCDVNRCRWYGASVCNFVASIRCSDIALGWGTGMPAKQRHTRGQESAQRPPACVHNMGKTQNHGPSTAWFIV